MKTNICSSSSGDFRIHPLPSVALLLTLEDGWTLESKHVEGASHVGAPLPTAPCWLPSPPLTRADPSHNLTAPSRNTPRSTPSVEGERWGVTEHTTPHSTTLGKIRDVPVRYSFYYVLSLVYWNVGFHNSTCYFFQPIRFSAWLQKNSFSTSAVLKPG